MTRPKLTYDEVIPAAHRLLEDCDEMGHSIVLGMALVKVLKRVPRGERVVYLERLVATIDARLKLDESH